MPAQLIERLSVCRGRALDHYCAHELDADPGQLVEMVRPLNGWLWCRRHGNGELGWLPAEKLQQWAEGRPNAATCRALHLIRFFAPT